MEEEKEVVKMEEEIITPSKAPLSEPIRAIVKNPEEARKYWDDYLAIRKAILTEEDFQTIKTTRKDKSGKEIEVIERSFPKKSAFRKLAEYFNLSYGIVGGVKYEERETWISEDQLAEDDIVVEVKDGKKVMWIPEEKLDKEKDKVLSSRWDAEKRTRFYKVIKDIKLYKILKKIWSVKTRCISPTMRICENWGSFSADERGVAHSEHDPAATAVTRGLNRVISDMISGGELSAEEILPVPPIEGKVEIEEKPPEEKPPEERKPKKPEEKEKEALIQKLHVEATAKLGKGAYEELIKPRIKEEFGVESSKELSLEQLRRALSFIEEEVYKRSEDGIARKLGFTSTIERKKAKMQVWDFAKRKLSPKGYELSDDETKRIINNVHQALGIGEEMTKKDHPNVLKKLLDIHNLLNRFYSILDEMALDLTSFLSELGIQERPELLPMEKLEELVKTAEGRLSATSF